MSAGGVMAEELVDASLESGRPDISKLPVSQFVGKPVQPVIPRILAEQMAKPSMDAQVHASAEKLEYFKSSRQQRERMAHICPRAPRHLTKLMRETFREARNARQLMACAKDPGYMEMRNLLEEAAKEESCLTEWQYQLCYSLRRLLLELDQTKDPAQARERLDSVYAWFEYHRDCFSTIGKGEPTEIDKLNLATEGAREDALQVLCPAEQMPGSSFYSGGGGAHGDDTESGVLAASLRASPDERALLGSPGERLREFSRHTVFGPAGMKKYAAMPNSARASPTPWLLSPSRAASPDCFDRPTTPSTTVGGLTSRSYTPALSSPTPGRGTPAPPGEASRPSSAMSYAMRRPGRPQTARGPIAGASSATPRPWQPRTAAAQTVSNSATARPGMMPPRSTPAAATRGAILDARPQSQADIDMEERWLARRHKEAADAMLAEEQRRALQAWASNRARVEEEILRNVEVARFQSDLGHRRYISPTDANEDIAPTQPDPVQSDKGGETLRERDNDDDEESDSSSASSDDDITNIHAVPVNAAIRAPHPPPKRFNVSKPGATSSGSGSRGVRFERDARQPLNDRVQHLRQLHASYLATTYDEASDGEGEEGKPPLFFDSEGDQHHLSLSAYTQREWMDDGERMPPPRTKDDSDALAATCSWWQQKQQEQLRTFQVLTIGDATMDEIRFQQQLEVEGVKRLFARRGFPVSAAVLESALVIPQHRIKESSDATYQGLFNKEPFLLSNPFHASKTKGKKKKGATRQGTRGKSGAEKAGAKKAPGKKVGRRSPP